MWTKTSPPEKTEQNISCEDCSPDHWKHKLCYLVKVTGTASLQELFVSTHRDAERVNHFVPMMLGGGDDVVVLPVQVLYLCLKY